MLIFCFLSSFVEVRSMISEKNRGEVKNVSANQRPGGHIVFSDRKHTNLVEDFEILSAVKIC